MRNTINQSLLMLCILLIIPLSTSANHLVQQASYSNDISNGWQHVERWKDTNSALYQEDFPPDGRGDQTGQRAIFFGNDATPDSSLLLLYYAPNWDTNSKETPVILIHGANQDADIAWANPNEAGPFGCGQAICPNSGLMQQLSNDNFKVFALSLAHKNGDGYLWAQHIANAIEIVKEKTGAGKVNLVTWSKSAFNARMYIASVNSPWGTDYRDDVDKLIMLGAPNNGIDWSFRHGTTQTYSVYPECGGSINGPTAHDVILCNFAYQGDPAWTYSSSYYPGSAQMLKRWDSIYYLSMFEQDWYSTYYGGWGYQSHALGIDAYMQQSLVDTVRSVTTPANTRVYNLCGNTPNIALIHNEHTGPSDGVVFVASCTDTVGVGSHGGTAVIPVNHLKLGWGSLAVHQIINWLNQL